MTRPTHKQRILHLLQTRARVDIGLLMAVTPRYGARVHDLRNEGHAIVCKPERDAQGRATGDWLYRLEAS